jgi:hypothetical protein
MLSIVSLRTLWKNKLDNYLLISSEGFKNKSLISQNLKKRSSLISSHFKNSSKLILAYPMTTPFKKLVQMVPAVDEPLTSVSDWCLESVRDEINRRKLKKLAKLQKQESAV